MSDLEDKCVILTIFDYNKTPPLPLISMVRRGKETFFHTFYLCGTGYKLSQIKNEMVAFKSYFDGTLYINDFKAHVAAFDLERRVDYKIYDYNMPNLNCAVESELSGKKILVRLYQKLRKRQAGMWQCLLANASVVYQTLEDTGLRNGYRKETPIYSLETVTGRSKTLGYNIQGTTDQDDINPVTDQFGYFLHFDWVSADLLMAAHMSGDKVMLESFRTSDPYSVIKREKNNPEITRDDCKKEFLKAMYSLSFNYQIFDHFPTLRDWLRERLIQMRKDGYLTSLMGRRYRVKGDNEKTVFNAQFQGSVAHAMQAALIGLFKVCRNNIFAEVHDSVILTASEVDILYLVDVVSKVMNNPLDGWCDNPPNMPVKVSIGKRWRKWRKYKEFR